VEKIRLAIKDDSPIVRKAAVLAIEERIKAARGRDSRSFVQDITLALADEDKEVRLAAAMALGKIRSMEAIEPLLFALQDEDIWVKAAALESLGRIGGGSAVKTIKGFVDDDNGMVVCAALEAMARIAAEEHQTVEEIKPWAAKCLSHNDTEVVKAAVQVIARIDKQGGVSEILPLLEHADWDVRAQVVDILSGRKDDFIKNCLETHLKVETDDLVKQKIAEALKEQ
ncbi:MAG: HEAT repeat domain-containing protein, partial [Deltaproteobacteria bacterium]|nr:HEAT repeat domain-containing protein [Deltaproteobacteria bacterium]